MYFLILFFVLYNWTGQFYPDGSGYHLDFLGDDLIPFIPEMAIFYVYLFFPMVFLTLIYFTFIDEEKVYALGWSIVIINLLATIIYLIFPVSTYWWRQELLANRIEGNFFANTMYFIYENETSFNCVPSMHAGMSTICFFTWYQYYKIKPAIKTKIIAIISFITACGVVVSTLFVKQHYIIDEVVGVFLAYFISRYVFRLFSVWKENSKLDEVIEKIED